MRRVAAGSLLASSTIAATATPAAAHGVGVRGDLPLPFYQFAWGAAAAVDAAAVTAVDAVVAGQQSEMTNWSLDGLACWEWPPVARRALA